MRTGDQVESRPLTGANLSHRGQNGRLRLGALMLAVALGATVLLVRSDVARGWRIALVVPFFMAAFGALQGLYRTCPGLAREGRCEASGVRRDVRSPQHQRAARRLARRVVATSLGLAVAATSAVALLP